MYSSELAPHQQRRRPSAPFTSGSDIRQALRICPTPLIRSSRNPTRPMADEPTQAGGVLDPQRALAFLAEAGAVLARSLDYERTLAEVAQLAVPEFADWCAADVVQADGSLRQITSGHPDPRMEDLLADLRRRYRAEKGRSEGRCT